MEQLYAFIDADMANRDAELLGIATAFRASQAVEKDWKRYVESLSKGSPVKVAGRKVATIEQIDRLMKASGGRAG